MFKYYKDTSTNTVFRLGSNSKVYSEYYSAHSKEWILGGWFKKDVRSNTMLENYI